MSTQFIQDSEFTGECLWVKFCFRSRQRANSCENLTVKGLDVALSAQVLTTQPPLYMSEYMPTGPQANSTNLDILSSLTHPSWWIECFALLVEAFFSIQVIAPLATRRDPETSGTVPLVVLGTMIAKHSSFIATLDYDLPLLVPPEWVRSGNLILWNSFNNCAEMNRDESLAISEGRKNTCIYFFLRCRSGDLN